ncbi:MAG: alcohol dehydrogenase, partial [Proteobacteria bacterium]|nr:alcohol dehydrogenase [Pseudomonadota bacterium]
MRGLTISDGSVRLATDLPMPVAGPGEALVRVLRAGVCNTDLELARGYMQFHGVPGHEFVGRVEVCDDASWVGARVVGEINCGCGACPDCRAGDSRHCPDRTVLGILGRAGTFADYVAMPIENLHRVPDSVSTPRAAFTEPLAAAFAITERLHVRPTDRVTVLGDGKLGLLVAQVLQGTACALELVGRHESKLDIAARRGIATCRLDGFTARLREGGRQAQRDIVVDCSGSVGGFALARTAVRPRGTLVLKTTCADSVSLDLAPLVIDEINVFGSRCGPFEPALRALASGAIDVDAL